VGRESEVGVIEASRSRRAFLGAIGQGAVAMLASGAASALAGCGSDATAYQPGGGVARLTVRRSAPTSSVMPGTYPITPSNSNDGSLVVPPGYSPSRPMPLMVSLHGAGIGPGGPLTLWKPYAESRGFLLLAVGARGLTWDVITSRFSYDVTFIGNALSWVYERCAVDASRTAIQGFSDGATYALGLGLANGDLFTHVAACSPGFIPASESPAVGKPLFFDSHGTQDPVLGIDNASRRIVPALKGRGYDVTYVEFDGGHTIPPPIATAVTDWMLR
jgi:phospholipase/carboxylesterase